ncbi:MAG TPA: STAS domain-containing protein [Bryobacteraceae bacterium]
MALQIQNREREGIAILDLNGRLTMGEEASALRDALRALAASGVKNVLLNLKELSYIDSTGLGALVVCFTTLRKQGGKLKLEHVNRRNIELLLFTKLTTIFELFNDETDAVNSFFPDRAIKHFDILSFIQGQSE